MAARLRALRAAAGFSGNQLAKHLGWPQSRVSKLELGRQMPTETDLDAWAAAVGATEDQHAELAALLAAARIEYANWRGVQRTAGGLATRHAERAGWEAATSTIREYQPALIPGIVQTVAYARALLTAPLARAMDVTEADADALIAERVKRQDILYQPGRTIQIVLGEAALRTVPLGAGRDVQVGQLDRLISFAGLPSVELGVVPRDVPAPVPPLSGFTVLNDHAVLIETLTGEQLLDDPEEVAVYVKAFGMLRDAALTGDAARAVLTRVAEEHRRLGQAGPAGPNPAPNV